MCRTTKLNRRSPHAARTRMENHPFGRLQVCFHIKVQIRSREYLRYRGRFQHREIRRDRQHLTGRDHNLFCIPPTRKKRTNLVAYGYPCNLLAHLADFAGTFQAEYFRSTRRGGITSRALRKICAI